MVDFKHILAWQRAHAMGVALHSLSASFPRRGHAHLKAELTKAADAIAEHIVEGCGAGSKTEFAHRLERSISSANSTEHHLLSAHALGLIADDAWHKYTAETVEIRKMVFGYRKRLLDDPRP